MLGKGISPSENECEPFGTEDTADHLNGRL